MSEGLAYLAAIALSLVFFYSASAKLRDPHPIRRAVKAAGLPASGFVTRAVAAVELSTAAVLLVRPAVGAQMSLVLLGIFTIFIASLLVRKIDVSCGCFGANATKTVSMVDVVRNVMLAAAAIVAFGVQSPTTVALEDIIAGTTAVAIGVVVLAAMTTRNQLGQFFDNRLPGER